MHSLNVLHRNICSEAVLVKENGEVKLSGHKNIVMLTLEEKKRREKKGKPGWASPEVAQGQPYGKDADIWMYGCFAFELLQGSTPFTGGFRAAQDESSILRAVVQS